MTIETTEEMNRHEMVKAFRAIFGADPRFPIQVTTFSDPATVSIDVNVNIEFGVTQKFKKRDILKMEVGSKFLDRKGRELREYLCIVMEHRIKEWRESNV